MSIGSIRYYERRGLLTHTGEFRPGGTTFTTDDLRVRGQMSTRKEWITQLCNFKTTSS